MIAGTEAPAPSRVAAMEKEITGPDGTSMPITLPIRMATIPASVPRKPLIISVGISMAMNSAHRIFIYEIPLLGMSFLRLRLASVLILPVVSGILTLAAIELISLTLP